MNASPLAFIHNVNILTRVERCNYLITTRMCIKRNAILHVIFPHCELTLLTLDTLAVHILTILNLQKETNVSK